MRTFEREPSVACPIRLDICVKKSGTTEIAEPIHILTANLTKAMRAIPNDTSHAEGTITGKRKRVPAAIPSSSSSNSRSDLSSFVTRLSKATLDDFELDKTSSFDTNTPLGQRNNHYTVLLLGLYEVAIEYEYNANKMASDKILNLFKVRKQLAELQKEVSSLRKSTHESLFSLGFIQDILDALFMQAEIPPSDRALKSNISFVQMIMSSVMDSLKRSIDDQYCCQDKQDFKDCVRICKALFTVLKEEDSDSIYVDQSSKKSISVLSTASTSLHSILKMVSSIWPDRFVECVAKIILKDSVPLQNTNKVLSTAIAKLKDIIQKYITGPTPIYREAANMLQILDFFSQKFDRTNDDYTTEMKHIITYLDEISKERPLEDSTVVKEIISQLAQACSSIGEFNIIHAIANDVHEWTGDLDVVVGQTQNEPELTYKIINTRTCSIFVSQLLSFLDQSFDDLIWCIGRLRSIANSCEIEAVKEFDDEICRRLSELLFATSELLKAVLTGSQAEILMRVLTKAYKTLLAFMKYKIAFPHDLTNEFVSLIEYVASEITDKMYKFLTVYGQKQESESAVKKGKRKERTTKAELQVVRQGKIIPALIFVVEQFERHLIQLSRKAKIDLMQYMKRSTSRDFRIKINYIPEEASSDEEEEETEEGSSKKVKAAFFFGKTIEYMIDCLLIFLLESKIR
ncbi:hypothetical protein K501DRAFT_308485 [Backusella circina FSU 941]|nr:hypothetical protein K501DRAFT_308485 [Backusella circina FSU 941]